jgi:magnesium-transporting ATPase (P-type)
MTYHQQEPEGNIIQSNMYSNSNETIPLTAMPEKKWKDEISPELEIYLDTKPTYGLTSAQVAARLSKFGKNELQEKKRSKIKHFLSFCEYFIHDIDPLIKKKLNLLISYGCYCVSNGNIHHLDCCNSGLG